MRILVTGGAGFIGSHVTAAYLDGGHEVCVVDNLTTGHRTYVPPGVRFEQVDIRDRALEAVFDSFAPEIVNHHAAQASVKVSTTDPVEDLSVNGGGTAWVATLAARHGVRKLIYASSGGTVYGNPVRLPVDESHPLHPVSPYGVSKLTGEEYVRFAHRASGLDFTILRYGNAFGPRQDPNGEAGVVAIFTGRMLSGGQCTIDGDGEQRKDYLYVGDIARANVLALTRGSAATCNIGTGIGTSVNLIFETLNAETRNTVPPTFGPPRAGDVRDFWLDCSGAREHLGWEPATGFREAIALTVTSFGG